MKYEAEQHYYQYKDAIMDAIGDGKMSCLEMANAIDVGYNIVKWVMFRLRNEEHLTSYTHNDITYYHRPKPHLLQTLLGHTINFTEDQIKSSTVYSEKDAKHNARHNHTQDSFHSSSIAGDGVKIGT